MLNTFKQYGWLVVVTLAGVSEQNAAVPGTTAIVIAVLLLKAIAQAVWLSLPLIWRNRLRRSEVATFIQKTPIGSQEHHHA